MAESHVISALMQKRAEVAGPIADMESRIGQARADLAHIDATILLFDPEANLAGIRAKRPKGRASLFATGELTKRCRDALRESAGEPIAAEAIAGRALADKGMDPEDAKLRRELIRRFLGALHRMQIAGTVEKVGARVWSAVEASGVEPVLVTQNPAARLAAASIDLAKP